MGGQCGPGLLLFIQYHDDRGAAFCLRKISGLHGRDLHHPVFHRRGSAAFKLWRVGNGIWASDHQSAEIPGDYGAGISGTDERETRGEIESEIKINGFQLIVKHASQTAEQMAAAYCDQALKKKREQIPFFFSAFLYMETNAA